MDQAFLEFQDKITALFPDIDKSQQESLNSVIGEAYRAASHIQSKKLGDRQERAKRSRTGGGEAVSGPRHFQPGHMEDTSAQQDGDGDKEGDDVLSDISEPDNNNYMDDVQYPPVPSGMGDDDEHADLIRPPDADDRAADSDSGRTMPFYEGDEEFWRAKEREAVSHGQAGSDTGARRRDGGAKDEDSAGPTPQQRQHALQFARTNRVFDDDYDISEHPLAKTTPAPKRASHDKGNRGASSSGS
jgi:hypothetical protein